MLDTIAEQELITFDRNVKLLADAILDDKRRHVGTINKFYQRERPNCESISISKFIGIRWNSVRAAYYTRDIRNVNAWCEENIELMRKITKAIDADKKDRILICAISFAIVVLAAIAYY